VSGKLKIPSYLLDGNMNSTLKNRNRASTLLHFG